MEWEREEQEKDEQRQKEWEREQQEKEIELAKSLKKELEEELGIESDFDGSGEGSISEVHSESQIDEDEGSLMSNNEHIGTSHVKPKDLNGQNRNVEVGKDNLSRTGDLKGRGAKQGVTQDFDDEESSQWDSSGDEGGENVRRSQGTLNDNDSREHRATEESQVSSMDNESRVRRDTGGSEGTFDGRPRGSTGVSDRISEVISEDHEGDLGESEGSFESERTFDDQDEDQERIMQNNNNNIKEPVLKQKDTLSLGPGGRAGITKDNQSGSPKDSAGNTGDTRSEQKQEDDLLEAYKARQEEMLEKERRIEEELARKEQEKLEEMRLQLEQRQEEERRKMAEIQRQRKEKELAMLKEKKEYENEMKRKQVERRNAEEERKRKEMERLNEIKRREEESKAR